MKLPKPLIQILTLIVLLFLGQVASATPGGLDAGTTFYLTVSEKSSIKVSQFSTKINAPIFSGVSNFAKGQKVRFQIGKSGQIIAKDMSIPMVRADSLSNVYMKQWRVKSVRYNSNGQMVKSKGKPDFLVLTFVRTSGSGYSTAVHTVSYTLE